MRVLLLSEFYPVVGGTAIAASRFAQALASTGRKVTVFAPYYDSQPYEYHHIGKLRRQEQIGENLTVYRISISKSMIPGAQVFSQWQQILRKTLLNPPDLIIAFTLGTRSLTAYLLKQTYIRRAAVIGWGRGSDVFITPKTAKGLHGIVLRHIFRRILRRLDLIFAQSEEMKEALTEYGIPSEKIRIMPNLLANGQYPRAIIRRECREVVYAGGARPEKGIAYLIKAMEFLPELKLRILGGWGPYSYTCRAIAGCNVSFYPPVPENEVKNELVKSDVLCLPSLSEGFPNVLLEAMACGMPIVATDIPGVRTVIENSGGAVVVPPKDTLALASALRKLANDYELRLQLSKAAIGRAKEFQSKKVLSRFFDVLRNDLHFNCGEVRL